ncbi:MAG: hypothetical protein IKP66_05280 [Lachnospiraceae bacterium]|nr:hypothetical protein [Lachnospiraceae bacterium]
MKKKKQDTKKSNAFTKEDWMLIFTIVQTVATVINTLLTIKILIGG